MPDLNLVLHRGLDNRVFYMLAPGGEYYNYSGCGNTVNCNHPIVRRFLLDCLRYWVAEYHVDGFRWGPFQLLSGTWQGWCCVSCVRQWCHDSSCQ